MAKPEGRVNRMWNSAALAHTAQCSHSKDGPKKPMPLPPKI